MKKFLITILICFTFTGIAYADLDDGLIAHWTFDGNVKDTSGNKNDGIIVGTTLDEALTKDRFLRQDKAFSFDGINDYIRVPLSETLDIITGRITISVWINIEKGLGPEFPQHYIFDSRDGEGGYAFNVDTDSNQFWVGARDSTFFIDIEPKEWYHLVMTYNEKTISLYIDGELTNREPFTEYFMPTTGPSWIGQRFNFIERFYGKMDDLRIYNRILSEMEILKLYQAPESIANFTADPISGIYPLMVNFSDQSTGDITKWFWDFGDSSTSTIQNPSHEYDDPGTYAVELTVTGSGGIDTKTKVDYIVVESETPIANFTADNTTGDAPLLVNFTDESMGTINTWEWNFGDNSSPSSKQDPSHTYNNPGIYTVSLTITSLEKSDIEIKTDYITVNYPEPDPPIIIVKSGSSGGCFIESIR